MSELTDFTDEEQEKITKVSENEAGITLIEKGKCPLKQSNPMACMFCGYGHMTECHYPHTCDSEYCHHYENEEEEEFNE